MGNFETWGRRERPGEKLDSLMRGLADKLNQELGEAGGVPLVAGNGAINMEAFGEFDVAADKQKIWAKDLEWSAADNPNVQEFYKEKYGAQNAEEIVARYRQEKDRSASGQLEKAVTAVFAKVLGSEYAVVRSATFDDYFGGIDNVLVNKKTGDVICAFDEVHGQAGQERHDKKMDKVKSLEGELKLCSHVVLNQSEFVSLHDVFLIGLKKF